MMKRRITPYIFASALALAVLIGSQAIWIGNAVHQKKENKKEEFEKAFNQSVSSSAFSLRSSQPYVHAARLDSIPGRYKTHPEKIIDLGKINSYSNAPILIENAFILMQIRSGKFSLARMDSLLRAHTEEMGKTVSGSLLLYSNEDVVIDSISYSLPIVEKALSARYTAERIIAYPGARYILRAEYGIAEQGPLRNMGIATLISLCASVIIIGVLLILLAKLKRWQGEMTNMERSFRGAIHDLKSPLAYVYLTLTSMEEKETDATKRGALSLSADRVIFLSDKIKRMLQSGRTIQKIRDNQKEEVYVYDLLEQIETEMRAVFPEKKITFKNQADSELAIRVSPDLFEAALRTLIENAAKYNDDRPIVTLHAFKDNNRIKITVADNGTGMTGRQLKHLFYPYYTTDKKEGNGIGIYYAFHIIKAHGGTLVAESEPGKGSLFTIALPE